jgi:hypothetical protein
MESLELTRFLSDAQLEALVGEMLDERHFDVVLHEATTGHYGGRLVFSYLPHVLTHQECSLPFDIFRNRKGSTNQGAVAGKWRFVPEGAELTGNGLQIRKRRSDGSLSTTQYSRSFDRTVFGYYPPEPRMPWCRAARFSARHEDDMERMHPFLVATNRIFRDALPEHWQRQTDFARRVSPDFVIRDTVWTGGVANRNKQTAAHTDGGDFGFFALSVMEAGEYGGAELILPAYRVAIDVRQGDLLLVDAREWHGNNTIIADPGNYIRLSIVLYTVAFPTCSVHGLSRNRTTALPAAS